MIAKYTFTLLLFLIFFSASLTAQKYQSKPDNFFGFHVKPLIPFGLVGDKPFIVRVKNFETTISPLIGYSYGAILRVGLTKLLAIETGINYARRNYRANYSIVDSNIFAIDEVSYISFDVPINFLVYIKLGNQLFMNVGIGASLNYNPSSIFSVINPKEEHLILFKGQRENLFDFNTNADIGIEYRTRSFGAFYIGVSGCIPFSPTLKITSVYRYGTYETIALGQIEGASFAFNFKYLFHNQKKKKGVQFEGGPIEQ